MVDAEVVGNIHDKPEQQKDQRSTIIYKDFMKKGQRIMSNGWIPTTERLPDQREFIESYVRSVYAAEFLVTIEGADKATTLYYSQTGVWFDEQGEPYKVVAWMPLPEVFKG